MITVVLLVLRRGAGLGALARQGRPREAHGPRVQGDTTNHTTDTNTSTSTNTSTNTNTTNII